MIGARNSERLGHADEAPEHRGQGADVDQRRVVGDHHEARPGVDASTPRGSK